MNSGYRVFIIVIMAFFLSSWVVRMSVYHVNDFDGIFSISGADHSAYHSIHGPEFWTTSFGITLKALIDILMTSILMKAGAILLEIPRRSFERIFKIVALSYLVFLLQLWIEFAFIKLFFTRKDYRYIQDFSFLSLHYFFKSAKIPYPGYLKYVIERITVFEIGFWIALILMWRRHTAITIGKASLLVTVSYIIPLLIWFLVIVFLSLIN